MSAACSNKVGQNKLTLLSNIARAVLFTIESFALEMKLSMEYRFIFIYLQDMFISEDVALRYYGPIQGNTRKHAIN